MKKLNPDLLQKINNQLINEKNQLLLRLEDLKKQDPFTNTDRLNDNADIDVEASEESDHDRIAGLIDELMTQIKLIDLTLQKAADGSYGTCTVCGQEINPQRLKLVITADKCINCESRE